MPLLPSLARPTVSAPRPAPASPAAPYGRPLRAGAGSALLLPPAAAARPCPLPSPPTTPPPPRHGHPPRLTGFGRPRAPRRDIRAGRVPRSGFRSAGSGASHVRPVWRLVWPHQPHPVFPEQRSLTQLASSAPAPAGSACGHIRRPGRLAPSPRPGSPPRAFRSPSLPAGSPRLGRLPSTSTSAPAPSLPRRLARPPVSAGRLCRASAAFAPTRPPFRAASSQPRRLLPQPGSASGRLPAPACCLRPLSRPRAPRPLASSPSRLPARWLAGSSPRPPAPAGPLPGRRQLAPHACAGSPFGRLR